VGVVKVVGEVPPWLRNVYPYKAWLNDADRAPVRTPYGTFYLRRGEYRILPNGQVVGRCRICGKTVTASARQPMVCWVNDCTHCPYAVRKPKCPGQITLRQSKQ